MFRPRFLRLALLLLISLRANAATIVSDTGAAFTSYSLGPSDAWTVSWSSTSGFRDVAVTARVTRFGNVGATGTAYLTTKIGAGTTASDEVAVASFAFPESGADVTLFSGLILPAGTYYLTLVAAQGGNSWLGGDAVNPPPTVTGNGVILNGQSYASLIETYPPGSTFTASANTSHLLFSVDGIAALPLGSTLASWLGDNGVWSNGSLWSTAPDAPINGATRYAAAIDSGTVTLDQDIDVEELTIGRSAMGGRPQINLARHALTVNILTLQHPNAITGPGTLSVKAPIQWSQGLLEGAGTTEAFGGIHFAQEPSNLAAFGRIEGSVNCYGSSTAAILQEYSVPLEFTANTAFTVMPGATFNGSHLMILGSDVAGLTYGMFSNKGTLIIDDAGANRGMAVFGTLLSNEGNILIANSVLDVRGTSNAPSFVSTGGTVTLNNGQLVSTNVLRIEAGELTGSGWLTGIESAGIIAPTGSGLDCQAQNLTLLAGSHLRFALVGNGNIVSCPAIGNAGAVQLAGTLEISTEAVPLKRISSTRFMLISARAVSGQFDNIANGQRLTTADGRGSFVVTYSATGVQLSQFKSKRKR